MEVKETFFESFFDRYLKIFDNKCKALEKKYLVSCTFPSVREYVHTEIIELTYLTLVYELNLYREQKKLVGNTSQERYEYFEQLVIEQEFLEYLNNEYPVLEKLITEKIDHATKCIENIVSDYLKDKNELIKRFGIKKGKILDIKIGAGDPHEFGKTVGIVKGEFGKIVYKPHSLKNDSLLNNIYKFLDEQVLYKPHSIKILDKNNHSWQEFIENKECNSEDEVKHFYYRLGCLGAVFFVFNSGDMHFENIIASGEFPYIVDTETLITVTKIQKLNKKLDIHNYPIDNILSTSLLPINNPNAIIDVDMSGISGGNFKSKSMKAYKIVNPNTDRMKVVRELIEGTTEQKNIPRLGTKTVNVLKYKEWFLKGLDDSLNSFMRNKDKMLKWTEQKYFIGAKQRQLFRDTYVYARFLEAAHHPTYLKSWEKRASMLQNLIGNGKSTERVKHEIKVLLEGYIPAFYSVYEKRHLYAQGEIIQKDFYRYSAKETVNYKIQSLTQETIRLQKHLANLSFMTLEKELFNKQSYSVKEKYYNYLFGFKEIFENILMNILTNPDDEKKDMYMIRMLKEGQALQGLDLSLYEGGGLIWALYSYANQIGNKELIAETLSLLESAESKQKLYHNNTGISIYSGIGSLIYLYYNFYKCTGQSIYWERYQYYLEIVEKEIENSREFDFIHGICGVAYLLLKIYEDSRDLKAKEALDAVIRIINMNLNEMCLNPEVGFAHGASGIAMTLGELYNYSPKVAYIDAMKKVLEIEEKRIDYTNYSWCRGIGGMVLARANIIRSLKNKDTFYNELSIRFHELLNELMNRVPGESDNLCLCHGVYGDYDILNCVYEHNYDILSKEERNILHSKIDCIKLKLVKITPEAFWLNSGYMLDSFMLGASGVGYALLRLYNTKYPSILNLELVKRDIKEEDINERENSV